MNSDEHDAFKAAFNAISKQSAIIENLLNAMDEMFPYFHGRKLPSNEQIRTWAEVFQKARQDTSGIGPELSAIEKVFQAKDFDA